MKRPIAGHRIKYHRRFWTG